MSVVAGWAAALAVNRSLRDVTGASMLPTLAPGDRLLVAPTWLVTPRRGAIVVVEDPRETGRSTVKRVVGLEGEAVEWRDGALEIDGVAQHEPYLDPAVAPGIDGAAVVGEGRLLVLGDARDASTDSRTFGPVPSHLVTAVVVAVVRPRPRLVPARPPTPR